MLASPAGEGEAPFGLPATSDEWLHVRAELCRRRRHLTVDQAPPGTLSPRQVGEALFRTLFTGQVGLLFAQSRGAVAHQEQGLRVRLRFRLDPADPRLILLHELPWELLCDPETRDFLALSRRTPVVRSIDVPRPLPSLPLPSGLRILVAMAETPGHPLDLRSERRHMQEVWDGVSGVEILDLDQTGIEALRATLLKASAHVLHLMGHGEIDPESQTGILVFPRPDGSKLPVTGETLAQVLKDFPTLRLVFLNACDTGRIPTGVDLDPFSGVATALVLGGIPAVVAMQLPVADDAAIAFSRTVYARLAQGDPIDAAVTEGRHAIHALHPESAEWAIPVLFTRISDGRIFNRSAAPSVSGREQTKRTWRIHRPTPWLLALGALLLALSGSALFLLSRSERPAYVERVSLGSFSIARYEVSNQEFLRFVKENQEWRRDRIRRERHDGDYLTHWLSDTEFPLGLGDHPVTHVSWFAARAFCTWAGGELPTQAQWAKAAHAAQAVYPWGLSSASDPAARLNFCDASCPGKHRSANPRSPGLNDHYPSTAPVAAFPKGQTREGVFNLSGNVWEWCLDASQAGRVTMGGSYSATFEECTTDEPSWEPARLCAPDGGFRCVWP